LKSPLKHAFLTLLREVVLLISIIFFVKRFLRSEVIEVIDQFKTINNAEALSFAPFK
jgi:hypothetical protein